MGRPPWAERRGEGLERGKPASSKARKAAVLCSPLKMRRAQIKKKGSGRRGISAATESSTEGLKGGSHEGVGDRGLVPRKCV